MPQGISPHEKSYRGDIIMAGGSPGIRGGDQDSATGEVRGSKVGRGTSLEPAHNPLRLALSQVVSWLRKPKAEAKKQSFPTLRNSVLDVLAEGRRKNIIHILFEADVAGLKDRLTSHRFRTGESITVTSYISKCFVEAITNDKRMQSYRLGRSQVVVFDDVDLAFMIEREYQGMAIPVFYIVRSADRKTAHDINQELRAAQRSPFGESQGPMSPLDLLFFHLPALLRKAVWLYLRHNPYRFKNSLGTVAVTSMGMHTSGSAVLVPITPMTLTLSIGSIEKKLFLEDGQVVERDVIHLNLSADHDLIDGAPLMRFVDRFKKELVNIDRIVQAGREHADQNGTAPASIR
jgi:hypothetical protein